MDLNFDESHQMLRRTARQFLESECPTSLVRELEGSEKGYSEELWRKMADLGWLGLPFPEKYEGGDTDLLTLALLHQEMGRAILPSPYLSTVVLGGLAILEAGSEEQKQTLLPQIARGETRISPALVGPPGTPDPSNVSISAKLEGGTYTLDGNAVFVHNAHVAKWFLCAARTTATSKAGEGITLFLVDAKSAGISLEPTPDISGAKYFELSLGGVRVPASQALGAPQRGWEPLARVLEKAAVLQSAEIIGTCEKVLDLTVDWAKRRVQFDKPIGFFQAVQHKCVNIQTKVEETKALTYLAAARISQGLPSRTEASQAKALASDTARYTAYEGHQVFAGIGFMQEHDMHVYSRRLKAAEFRLGDTDFHHRIVADAIAAGSGKMDLAYAP